DVFPAAKDLLYYFVDSTPNLRKVELEELIRGAGVDLGDVPKLIDFLLYYGILGIRGVDDQSHYIYNVAYDLKVLQVRVARAGEDAIFVMNPAFRSALGIVDY
ncbi:hypothetical protein, partial [Roseateles sp.]|uniref:hypothetical protein n=1 Tax=Roseateles sp. TaxID=1971397 RepID=UPI0031D39FC0